jgi:Arc/MetJ-type ribon-helix-helix transcriptional regulator
MKITLTPDTEAIVNAAMATGMYVSRSEFIREVLRERFDVKQRVMEQLQLAAADPEPSTSDESA